MLQGKYFTVNLFSSSALPYVASPVKFAINIYMSRTFTIVNIGNKTRNCDMLVDALMRSAKPQSSLSSGP